MPPHPAGPQLSRGQHTGLSSATNFFFRKRRFSGGDVCGVAPVPPPAGDRGGATGGFEAELGNVEFCYEWVMVTNLIQSIIVYITLWLLYL